MLSFTNKLRILDRLLLLAIIVFVTVILFYYFTNDKVVSVAYPTETASTTKPVSVPVQYTPELTDSNKVTVTSISGQIVELVESGEVPGIIRISTDGGNSSITIFLPDTTAFYKGEDMITPAQIVLGDLATVFVAPVENNETPQALSVRIMDSLRGSDDLPPPNFSL